LRERCDARREVLIRIWAPVPYGENWTCPVPQQQRPIVERVERDIERELLAQLEPVDRREADAA
jgi:hypothetical protein